MGRGIPFGTGDSNWGGEFQSGCEFGWRQCFVWGQRGAVVPKAVVPFHVNTFLGTSDSAMAGSTKEIGCCTELVHLMRSRSPPPTPPNRCCLRLVRVAFGSIGCGWAPENTFGLACDSSLILISPSTTSCGRSEHNLCLLLPQNITSCDILIHVLPQIVLF